MQATLSEVAHLVELPKLGDFKPSRRWVLELMQIYPTSGITQQQEAERAEEGANFDLQNQVLVVC